MIEKEFLQDLYNLINKINKLDEVQKAFDDTMSNRIMKAYINIGE